MRRHINGILLLDKPIDMTSNRALQMVKHLFNAKKAGHTGSLDPIATGMLPICFGEATKFSQFLLESDKSYHVVAQLGVQTTTGDSEGEVMATNPIDCVTESALENIIPQFIGDITQIPPMFSAIKHQGQPLYKLARQGIEIERQPRHVKIFSLKLEKLEQDKATFVVHCSKGTYIRTLVEDIGKELGCGAHVCQLRRLAVTPYQNALMYTLTELETLAKESGQAALSPCLLPVETAVQVFPTIKLSTSAAFYLRMGQPVRITSQLDSPLVRLVAEDSRFLGVGEVMSDGRVKPHRLISQSPRA